MGVDVDQDYGIGIERMLGLTRKNEEYLNIMRGERIYQYEVDMTGTIDFGIELAAILDGRQSIPPQGARFDAGFSGRVAGRISGRISGTDHAYLRPDGSFELNLRGVIETDDGCRLALMAGGIGVLRAGEPVLDLSENVNLLTASEHYAWINARQIWAIGTANLATGKIQIDGYLQ